MYYKDLWTLKDLSSNHTLVDTYFDTRTLATSARKVMNREFKGSMFFQVVRSDRYNEQMHKGLIEVLYNKG